MLKNAIIHPFLFSLYPILLVYSVNIDRTPISNTYRISLLLLFGTLLSLLLFRLLTRSWQRASLITTLGALLFSSYGYMYNLLNGKTLFGIPIGQANYIAALWASLMIILGWVIWRKLAYPHAAHKTFNIIAIILVIFPLASILYYFSKAVIAQRLQTAGGLAQQPVFANSNQRPPDIYYIILDEYGRADMLKQVLGFDNSAFIRGLEERGFYVAENSHSNYGITLSSISSSLNFRYINDSVSSKVEDTPNNTRYLLEIIDKNSARDYLQKTGYNFVTFATGYPFSEIQDSDLYIEPENYLNGFEMQYVRGSVLAIFSDSITAVQERSLILNSFHSLAVLPEMMTDKPKFVFAHIQSNHVPFVFGPNGEPVPPWAWPAVPGQLPQDKTYAQAYRDQAVYMNKLILHIVDAILANSKTRPVIILQGDHGTEQKINWYSLEESCVKERMSILNAYYFPDADYKALYPSITPVNTFRTVFDQYFGSKFGLVEDHVYFSLWDKSYDFIDVTDKMVDCTP